MSIARWSHCIVTNSIVAGSIAAVTSQSRETLATHFLYNVSHIIVVDVSGSMSTEDSRGNRSRIDVAREELANLQASHPGKLAVFAFSDHCQFVPGGVPPFFAGGTDVAGALRTVKEFDGLNMRFVVISDGLPDQEQPALDVAKTYMSKLDTVFVGNESDQQAQAFLRKLAGLSGGQAVTTARVQALAEAMRPLLALPA
jgi:Mg-chelatase subunit ChlD